MVLKWAQNGPEIMKNMNRLNHSLRSEDFSSRCGFSYLHSVVLEVLLMCFHRTNLECVIVHIQWLNDVPGEISVAGVAMFKGVGSGTSVPAANGLWQAWLSGIWSALCLATMCSVVRLFASWPVMCFFSLWSFWYSASIRASEVTFCCIYEFVDFHVAGELFCIQDVQIFKGFGVVTCPLEETVLCGHFFSFVNNGLEMVAFMNNVPWQVFFPIGPEMVIFCTNSSECWVFIWMVLQ